MEQSPRLFFSYVAPNQAQKHVTVNEGLRRLDALVQAAVLSRTLATEPASPAEGDAYILPGGASGDAWDAFDAGDLAAFQDGAWARIVPAEGFRVWVCDDDEFVLYDGAGWGALSGGGAGGAETAAKFGINTSADATNRLAVKSDAVLFSHDDVTPGSGDAQVKVNKAASGDTASHLFQTNFSGRAEFGLTGDDDFHVKVSANGSSWTDALLIDKDNGYVGVGSLAPKRALHVKATEPGLVLEDSDHAVADEKQWRFFGVNGDFAIDGINDAFVSASRAYKISRGGVFPTSHEWTTSAVVKMTLASGLVVGAPTGGDKGAGTINAEAVYVDDVLLSCYVFDQALDGGVDMAKWDAKAPDRRLPAEKSLRENPETRKMEEVIVTPARTEPRRHEPARRFVARAGTQYDPLTLDGYAKHWREKRHLSSMPDETTYDPEHGQLTAGEWIQRLVETVEIQAILIEQLNARVKTLAPPGRLS